MSHTSVVTLHRGRPDHLARLLEGLGRGRPLPDECVIVEMGQDDAPTGAVPFPIRQVTCPGERLPLAAARNLGRRSATGETLVFLDVDCVPSANLVGGLTAAAEVRDGLVCCEVRYLPAEAVGDDWTEAGLSRAGRTHPARRFPDRGVARADNPGLFWSLAFAVRAATFDRIGGFDEGFVGYGGEDTDLAFRAAGLGIPILFAGGMRAFHQHHPAFDPPIQHVHDIVANARRFRERHGLWPMQGWLDAFARLGLVSPDRSRDLYLLRDPTPEEIEAARLPPGRPF